jgi:hypothetical protein
MQMSFTECTSAITDLHIIILMAHSSADVSGRSLMNDEWICYNCRFSLQFTFVEFFFFSEYFCKHSGTLYVFNNKLRDTSDRPLKFIYPTSRICGLPMWQFYTFHASLLLWLLRFELCLYGRLKHVYKMIYTPAPWPQSDTSTQTQSHTETVLIHYSKMILKTQIPQGHLQTNVPKTSVSFSNIRKL